VAVIAWRDDAPKRVGDDGTAADLAANGAERAEASRL
jgi:hypothetical protein